MLVRLPHCSCAFFLCFSLVASAQRLARFEVTDSGFGYKPVSVDLDALTSLPASDIRLLREDKTSQTPVPFQVEAGMPRKLVWLHEGERNGTRTIYSLHVMPATKDTHFQIADDGNDLTLQFNSKNLVRYRYTVMRPPAGIDSAYSRSAFIHPLWSPHGQELTRIQPPDHYHHYGIWNPWTHVLYRGDTIDFWNIGGKSGTVRFGGFVAKQSGPVFAQFEARQEHVVLRLKGRQVKEVALNELLTIRVYRPKADCFIMEMTSTMNPAGDYDFAIIKYRYAGLGWRTTGQWDRNNSSVLTSEQKTRKDADGTKARWCIVQGMVDSENAGAVMMSFPANFNHPEPLRIWPENQYDRGDMFASFSTTKDRDWVLKPGNVYILRYRFLVFNGTMNFVKAEQAWQDLTSPAVTVRRG